MKKETVVVWIFPVLTSTVIFIILFATKFNRPVTGLTIGIIIGFILGVITKLIYDDCFKFDKLKGFMRFDDSSIESFDELIKVPYYFLYIWVTPLFMYLSRFLKYFIIFGGIIIIIYLIVHAIIKGL